MTESSIQISGPSGPLCGTLLSPEHGRELVMLIIPGSGPVDRDGNVPNGLLAAPYRLLSEGLVGFGVTTLRIDKRGSFESSGAVANRDVVTIEDYASDVSAWVKAMCEECATSCIWLLGHSEGGLVAMIAAQNLPEVCGLVLLSTPGRRMGDLLREQFAKRLSEDVLDQGLAAISTIELGRQTDVATLDPSLHSVFGPGMQNFLVSAFRYDPADLLRDFRRPVLIIQGQRDLQVSDADACLLKAACQTAELILVPNMNHVLKVIHSDDLEDNIAGYTDPNLPIAPGVISAITKFLQKKISLLSAQHDHVLSSLRSRNTGPNKRKNRFQSETTWCGLIHSSF